MFIFIVYCYIICVLCSFSHFRSLHNCKVNTHIEMLRKFEANDEKWALGCSFLK